VRAQLVAACIVSLALASCRTKCEDLVPESLPGSYRGGASLGDERLLNLALEVEAKRVMVTFTTKDGHRVRAHYRVDKKSRRKLEPELPH